MPNPNPKPTETLTEEQKQQKEEAELKLRQAIVANEIQDLANDMQLDNFTRDKPCQCRKTAGFTTGWCAVASNKTPQCEQLS